MNILMVSVIYVHFSQLVGSCNIGTHLITLLNITYYRKISVDAFELQVSQVIDI